MTPLRILVWSDRFPPSVGGLERVVTELYASLVDRGHVVRVIADHDHDPPGIDEYRGMEVVRVPLTTAHQTRDVRGFADVMRTVEARTREFDPDVHDLHPCGGLVAAFLRARDATTPSRVTLHHLHGGYGIEVGAASLTGRLYDAADRIVCVSEAVRRETLELRPDLAARLETIPNGIADAGGPLRAVPTDPVVLCIGRLAPDKGFDQIGPVLRAVSSRLPGVSVRLIGAGPSSSDIASAINTAGVDDRVTWLGELPHEQVLEQIDEAMVVYVPSRHEGFSLVAAEALSRGRAVVATPTGALPQMVEPGTSGFLVGIDDVDAHAEALVTILADRALALRMGDAARAAFTEHLGLQRMVQDHERSLLGLLGR